MPEGDTVWLAGRRLRQALAGRVLTRTDFRVPRLATVDLSGRRVLDVHSRGKHLLLRISGELTLHTHFRMDGSWHLARLADPAGGGRHGGGPAWQIRVVLTTAEWRAVGYRLPVVELLPTAREDRAVGHLGPDLLGSDWDPQEAVLRLGADPEREIGQALLDQRHLAGIGNLYRTEVCFLAGVSPWTPVAEVRDLTGMVTLAQRLMASNRSVATQATTGSRRRGEEHWVFERTGLPCRRCRTPIARAEQGLLPGERITYWCPRYQPGSRPPG